jgi:hypothetical protein
MYKVIKYNLDYNLIRTSKTYLEWIYSLCFVSLTKILLYTMCLIALKPSSLQQSDYI